MILRANKFLSSTYTCILSLHQDEISYFYKIRNDNHGKQILWKLKNVLCVGIVRYIYIFLVLLCLRNKSGSLNVSKSGRKLEINYCVQCTRGHTFAIACELRLVANSSLCPTPTVNICLQRVPPLCREMRWYPLRRCNYMWVTHLCWCK